MNFYWPPIHLLFLLAVFSLSAFAQSFSAPARQTARELLKQMKTIVKEEYYDPKLRKVDFDSLCKQADDRIKIAANWNQVYEALAAVLLKFEDSHTVYLPPVRLLINYGWRMQMIGNRCLITSVESGSDAEKKGLKAGDQIVKLDGITPANSNLWTVKYLYYVLRPQHGVSLLIQNSEGKVREIEVKVLPDVEAATAANLFADEWHEVSGSTVSNQLFHSSSTIILTWKMMDFNLTNFEIDLFMARAKKHQSLILDLRGNRGGEVEALQHLLRYFFDREIHIGTEKNRKETKKMTIQPIGKEIFTGKLIVLVDSDSGSASEHFARIIQMEKRGKIIGDRTRGAVMKAKKTSFGSMSVAEILMPDGKSLEKIGVTPDEILLPDSMDLMNHFDPVLSRAFFLSGLVLGADDAGRIFNAKGQGDKGTK
jgi:C-terminal processing protease CtpA/Prc